jgi:hypothetical protein
MPFRYALGEDARTRELARALAEHRRIAICGAPETGKSKLVEGVTDRPIVHTDDWLDYPIADQPLRIVEACRGEEAFVIEGTLVARALRKGLGVDVLLWLVKPMGKQTPKQKALGKGLATIFEGIRETLAIPIVVIP